MRVKKIDIAWHSGMPVFASESFLKAVGDEYGWLGGFDTSRVVRCILPYTIIRKAIFKMVRFRVETIMVGNGITIEEESCFLNNVVNYFRSMGADMIIPATTNTIFRTYPQGADAAPYGSYVIDMLPPEETIWLNIGRITRQNINSAKKNGIVIKDGMEDLNAAYSLIVDTFKRSKLPFMGYNAFQRYMGGLGANGKMLIADYQGSAQSYVVFAFSNYCAYAVYAGNVAKQFPGSNKLLYWEAMRMFKGLGVQKYDFVGARINPAPRSKQEGINSLKKRFGAKLYQGYMWKYQIKPLKYHLYNIAARIRSGGDIVDAERHKL